MKLIVSIIIFIIIPVFIFKTKNILSVRSSAVISFVLVYFLSFYVNGYRSWVHDTWFVVIIILSFFSFLFFLTIFKRKSDILKRRKFFLFNNNRVKLLQYILSIVFGILIFLEFKTYGFSFRALLFSDRVEQYLSSLDNINRFVGNLVMFLQVPLLILLSYLYKNKQYKEFFIFWLLLLFYYIISAHTRYFTLFILVIPFLLSHVHKKKIPIRKAVLVFCICVIFLTIANFIRNGAFKTGETGLVLKDPSVLIGQIEMTVPMGAFYDIYNDIEDGIVNIEYGKQYYYYFPISFIPRMFWEGKPIVSYFHRMTKIVAGRLPGPDQQILTSTFIGEGFHEFGFLAIILTPFLYSMIIYYYLRFLIRFEYSELLVMLTIFMIPMDIRGGLGSTLVNCVSNVFVLIVLRHTFIYKKVSIRSFQRLLHY